VIIMTREKVKTSERIQSLRCFAHHKSSTDWPEIELESPHFAVVPLVCVCRGGGEHNLYPAHIVTIYTYNLQFNSTKVARNK
jgi:hypothetical protein